jgi:hypothetical protein
MTFPADPPPQPTDPAGSADGDPLGENWDLDEDSAAAPVDLPATLAPQPSSAAPQPALAAATPTSPAQSLLASRLTRGEKLALAFSAALLLVVAIWMLRMLAQHVPTTHTSDLAVRYPVAGSHATLASVETFWRPPVTSGPAQDRFRQGARLLPVARITLDASSGSGALRVFFRNQTGATVGDPTTLAFANGRFDNATAVADIIATDGFREDAMHAAYLADQSAPWMLDLREGPSPTARAEEFKPLLEIPISADRR